MSTILQAITRADELKHNAFSVDLKVSWLSALDGKIAADVFRLSSDELTQFSYRSDDLQVELLVPFPHDDIYALWLAAQIDFANGEYNRYQNTMLSYNAAFDGFVNWFCSTYDPAQGHDEDCCSCPNHPPYYMTAYGLAVKHGFQGTENEWLASLIGADGKPGNRIQLRYAEDSLQWRYVPADGDEAGAGSWEALLDIAAFRDMVVNDTLAQAQAFADAAKMSENAAYSARSGAEYAATKAEMAMTNAAGYADSAAAAAQRAEEAANASDNGTAGKDGLTPHIGENGNWWIGETDTGAPASGFAEELQPLHLKVASAVRDGNSATVDFDGTSEKELVIPAGFKRISATNSQYIESIEGLAVLYGNFKPNNYKSEFFSFTNALAFGNVSNGVRYVYIADTRTNTQYRFIFDSAWAFGRYEVITAPLLNESSGGGTIELQPLTFTGAVEATYDGTEPVEIPIPTGGGGGGYKLLHHIVTTERVSSILVNTEAKTPAFYRIRMYVPKVAEGESASGNSKLFVNGNKGLTNFKLMSSGSNFGHLDAELSCISNSLIFSVFCNGAGVDAATTKIGHLGESSISSIEITAASDIDFPVGTEYYLWEMETEGDTQ